MYRIDHWIAADSIPGQPAPGRIDLWLIDLETGVTPNPALLSRDELVRWEKIVREKDRQRFLAVRCAVRTILSGYLGDAPEMIRFGSSDKGKPHLQHAAKPIHFNLSHSSSLALLAVSCDQEIGIDLEFERPRPSLRRIARKLFDRSLLQQLERLPEAAFVGAFFRHWTALEARAKTVGEGVFTFRDAQQTIHWTNFTPLPGCCAAVAVSDRLPSPEQWRTFRLTPKFRTRIG